MPVTSFTAGTAIKSADVNSNFGLCVLTDTARTITVTHTWSASQTFSGGWTAGAACTISSGGIAVTGNSTITGTLGGVTTLTTSGAINGQTISATASFTGTVTVATGLTVSAGGAAITGNSTVAGTFTVASASALATLNATTGGSDIYLQYQLNGTAKAYVGLAPATNGLVTGSATGDVVIRAQGGAIRFSTDSGLTSSLVLAGAAGTSTFSAGVSVTGDFAVNTSKFTVAAASGNTVVAGTLNVTGTITGNLSGNVTGTILTAAQANITSVGTLTSLTVSNDITTSGGSVTIGGGLHAAGVGEICLGNNTGTTVGAAGGASALPATPLGYWSINIAGTTVRIPYYN